MSVIVVGAGAAGLAAAHYAARHGSDVRVLERTAEAGKKILLSGGTRCNVLPVRVNTDSDYFTSCKLAMVNDVFRSWDLESCQSWLQDDLGIQLTMEESSNKYFPTSNSAREVRDALLKSCLNLNVEFSFSSSVSSMRSFDGEWECLTTDRRVFNAEQVILAAGGKSYPKVGTDGTGFEILKKLGHSIETPYPALTPLHGPHPANTQLAGLSLQTVNVSVDANKNMEYCSDRSGLLFTHKGYSGPSVLDISHFYTKDNETNVHPKISINWSSEHLDVWEKRLLDRKWKGTLVNYIQRFGIPLRLADALCASANVPKGRLLSQLTKRERMNVLNLLTSYQLECTGDGGYKLAEVTGGGVPFKEINCKTMESTIAPGIFICGELMNIFGRIGGFNFYWAWVSGRLAGINASPFKQI